MVCVFVLNRENNSAFSFSSSTRSRRIVPSQCHYYTYVSHERSCPWPAHTTCRVKNILLYIECIMEPGFNFYNSKKVKFRRVWVKEPFSFRKTIISKKVCFVCTSRSAACVSCISNLQSPISGPAMAKSPRAFARDVFFVVWVKKGTAVYFTFFFHVMWRPNTILMVVIGRKLCSFVHMDLYIFLTAFCFCFFRPINYPGIPLSRAPSQ